MTTAITAAELLAPTGRIADPVLLFEDGYIVTAGPRDAVPVPPGVRTIDFPGAVLAPAFIDLHIHGAAGYDVMEGKPEGLRKMASFLARHGVGSFLATTVTAELDVLVGAVERIAEQIDQWDGNGTAVPFGIHLEGPCISMERRGVHPESYIVNPTPELFDRLHKAAGKYLRLITIAPELPGSLDVIREAARRGVKVSLGHTNGFAKDAVAAIEAGASHATHTFNAMRPLDHRNPGVLGEILDNNNLSAEIIADGVHVDPTVVDLFLRCKGNERAVLVTDSISAAGMPDGTYKLGSFEVTVHGLKCEWQGRLAGSVLTLDRAVRNVMEFSGWDLRDSVQLASANPARVIGDQNRGRLEAGARADIAVLSTRGEVLASFVGGIPSA
ncbi:MAG TPA: N-acetylglucosamine-6-phosphate deacetylase [Terriglobales bacterium]